MELLAYYILLAAILSFVIFSIKEVKYQKSRKRKTYNNQHPDYEPAELNKYKKLPAKYQYRLRKTIATPVEVRFYHMAKTVCGGNLEVFPQVHLSSILSHEIKGQSWKGAFRRINGKSVDFLLCHPQSLRPIAAIEIDDKTHLRLDRIERDNFVNGIFQEAGIPLIRIDDLSIDSDSLKKMIVEAINSCYPSN